MQRRTFFKKAGIFVGASGLISLGLDKTLASPDSCAPDGEPNGITGQSQGFLEIRHQHEFLIPLAVLIQPPPIGYAARCSPPMQGRTDFEGLRSRTDSVGRPLDLRAHAHTVRLTQEQLNALALGRHATVVMEQFGHSFYFVADDDVLKAVQIRKEVRR